MNGMSNEMVDELLRLCELRGELEATGKRIAAIDAGYVHADKLRDFASVIETALDEGMTIERMNLPAGLDATQRQAITEAIEDRKQRLAELLRRCLALPKE